MLSQGYKKINHGTSFDMVNTKNTKATKGKREAGIFNHEKYRKSREKKKAFYPRMSRMPIE